jgi:hypothetical protein
MFLQIDGTPNPTEPEVTFQEFFAPSSSTNSFLRWTADLSHIFYLYGYTQSAAKNTDTNGPVSG